MVTSLPMEKHVQGQPRKRYRESRQQRCTRPHAAQSHRSNCREREGCCVEHLSCDLRYRPPLLKARVPQREANLLGVFAQERLPLRKNKRGEASGVVEYPPDGEAKGGPVLLHFCRAGDDERQL